MRCVDCGRIERGFGCGSWVVDGSGVGGGEKDGFGFVGVGRVGYGGGGR